MDYKPHIPVTLICVDTTPSANLAERAIEKCLEQASFETVRFLTNDPARKFAVPIPEITSLEDYSRFMCRDLYRYVHTSHALVIQYDGYVLNGAAWTPHFLSYDYIGAPWPQFGRVGNGGFSLRSKRLLEATAKLAPAELPHPEDAWICNKHRFDLESLFGMRFPDLHVAGRFAFEGRSFDGVEWRGMPTAWNGQFGFHSWLTVLPPKTDRPLIFHHSGDAGDVIYSLPTMAALGGGVLFLSGDNRYPYPRPTRWCQGGAPANWSSNLASLLNLQPYVWKTLYTHALPFSTDIDFNRFREAYQAKTAGRFDSLFALHQKPFGVSWPEDLPWLRVDKPVTIPGKDIIVSRSERFHNDDFPWRQLVEKYGKRMAFVGSFQEAALFQQLFKTQDVIHQKTDNLLEVARLIAGAKAFIGNQSCPLAIALGLGQNVLVETWLANSNCMLRRQNAIHWRGGHCDLPTHWLS